MSVHIALKWAAPQDIYDVIVRWNFDLPKAKQSFESGNKIRIKGWVLTKGNMPVSLILKSSHSTKEYVLNQLRQDVIRKVLHEEPEGHTQQQCGFVYDIEFEGDSMAVGFRLCKRNYWIGNIKLERARKVLLGRNGNLFLDNDTNHCIEQYQGLYKIPDSEILAWDAYIDALSQIENKHSLKTALIIAPGKEFICSEDFPFERGATTPVDEIFEAFSNRQRIVYPLKDLLLESNITYSSGDTHWTDYGALVAARALCASFGHDFSVNIPRFKLVMGHGDLGVKLAIPPSFPFYRADFSETSVALTFANGVHNHGRVYRYENLEALNSSRILLYGDSFSVNLAPWLSLYYREVLYIHTAGSIDMDIVAKFSPDFLIVQTNTRFLIKSPTFELKVDSVITSKLRKMRDDEISKIREKVLAQADSYWKLWTIQLIEESRMTAA